MDGPTLHRHAGICAASDERERPPMWRYWRSLPPKGRIGILPDRWYSIDPPAHRKPISLEGLDAQTDQINRFEAMLVKAKAPWC